MHATRNKLSNNRDFRWCARGDEHTTPNYYSKTIPSLKLLAEWFRPIAVIVCWLENKLDVAVLAELGFYDIYIQTHRVYIL